MFTLPIDQHSTVLVTGATGFVGRALIHQLSLYGCHIRVLARSELEAETLATNYQAELFRGDILSDSAVRDACYDVTHVFHLAGHGQSGKHNAAEIHKVNVEGTKILARAVAEETEVEHFVHISTSAVHGNIKNGPANETSKFAANSRYEVSKLEAETWLREFAISNALPLTVLRPCAIVGPGDYRLLKLFKLAKLKLIPLPGTGKNRYQFIHVDDCVRVMLATTESDKAIGETYVCGNAEALSLREILLFIHGAAHRSGHKHNRSTKTGSAQKSIAKPLVIPLPLRTTKALAWVLEKVCALFRVTPPITAARLEFFGHNHWFDTTKMQTELNIELQNSNATSLQATLNWYKTNELL